LESIGFTKEGWERKTKKHEANRVGPASGSKEKMSGKRGNFSNFMGTSKLIGGSGAYVVTS